MAVVKGLLVFLVVFLVVGALMLWGLRSQEDEGRQKFHDWCTEHIGSSACD